MGKAAGRSRPCSFFFIRALAASSFFETLQLLLLSSSARPRTTNSHGLQSPAIALVTRQGAGNLLFGSDVFIEDRVAAGLVGGEDVLVATAVDLMMARECEGRSSSASAV